MSFQLGGAMGANLINFIIGGCVCVSSLVKTPYT